MKVLLVTALSSLACASLSPRAVAVGDQAVSGAGFEPYENLWNWAFIDAQGKKRPQGTWSDRLEIEDADGRRVGRRTQEQRLPDGRKIVTENVFDLATLAPIERDWRVFDGRFTHLRFDGREVERRAIREAAGAAQTARFSTPEAFFDFNGGMYGLLLRGFPLREGYSATFPALEEDGDRVQRLRLIVHGRERVPGRGGAPVEAWRVEIPESDYGKMTFWLSDRPPYVIRLTFPMKGGTIAYEMA